jgi:transposase
MSMRPEPIGPVPEDTARVARAAFPKGNLYMQIRDVLGTIYADEDFSELFEARGRPSIAPWRLALVTVMQFSEGLSDRQAAEAVRARIDWNFYDVVKRRRWGRTPYRRAASPTGH